MPARRVNDPIVVLGEFDTIGQDGVAPFIRHLGLAAVAGEVQSVSVSVYDMGPPLRAPGEMMANVHGSAELDDNQRQKLKIFKDTHAQEHAARQLRRWKGYVVHPHFKEVVEKDGTHVFTKFSCAGFVIEAYGFARINLLDFTTLPEVGLATVCQAYPDLAAELVDRPTIRRRWGIDGEGPWPIVLCGYVVHSLKRTRAEILAGPYKVQPTDLDFA